MPISAAAPRTVKPHGAPAALARLGVDYDLGGRSTVENAVKDDDWETLLHRISAGLALNRQLSAEIAYLAGRAQKGRFRQPGAVAFCPIRMPRW